MKTLKKFLKDIQGGFAFGFAGASLALVIIIGAAIDINQAHKAKSYLQDLTDGAALTAALDNSSNTKDKREVARTYIKTAFETNYKLKILEVELEPKKNGAVRVTTNAHLETMMMSIINKDSISLIKIVSK